MRSSQKFVVRLQTTHPLWQTCGDQLVAAETVILEGMPLEQWLNELLIRQTEYSWDEMKHIIKEIV